MKKLLSRGDTIIEVLLALTIVSTMLGGAYVLANRSLNGSRTSQERGEATKIAETQLERLKNAINGGDDEPFTTTDLFCMDGSNEVAEAYSPTSSTVPALLSDNLDSYNDPCKIQNQSLPYYVSIEPNVEGDDNKFTARVRWDRLGASGRNEVKLIYRVYEWKGHDLISQNVALGLPSLS